MKRLVTIGIVALCALLIGSALGATEKTTTKDGAQVVAAPIEHTFEYIPAPPEIQQMMAPTRAPLNYVPKSPGHYSAQDWRAVIDSTWGPGFSPALSQAIWETWWHTIDSGYASFQGLDTNVWDSMYTKYNPELLDYAHPVSKGRLDAILEHSALALKDEHTRALDTVCDGTAMLPGVPLMHMLWQYDDGHFGAGLTALPDSTAMVVRVVPDHPLGLVPGDIILGYDRIPWLQLVQELMEAELPIRGMSASSDRAIIHYQIMSAGMNWHLYDTIDIEKYGTHDTLHLPTSLLAGQNMQIWPTEQLDIPGVQRPNFLGEQIVSWGIIEGTSIGYIYINGYFYNIQSEWYRAVDSLVNHYPTTGIIIDSRMNMGGNTHVADAGNALLFDTVVETFRLDARCPGGEHFTMCRPTWPQGGHLYDDSLFMIRGTGGYSKPIAILLGPASISGGDFYPAMLAHHPMAKVFGKPSCGGFGPVQGPYFIYPAIKAYFARGNAYHYDKPGEYLTHKGFPDPQYYPEFPFQEVWLTRDGVAQGRDDVVEAAKAWILSRDLDQDGIVNESDNCPEMANVDQADVDQDGLGNLCDSDNDGDGVDDVTDNCPSISNPTQADANSDGIGDACCCIGGTGNVNYTGIVDLSDLSSLVSYLTGGGYTLPCPNESNVNATGIVDLSDLSSLVSYLTGGGYVLPNCM